MAAPTYLNVTLKLMALYAGVMGALSLLFQDAGSFVFRYTLKDPMLTRYWGGVLLAMAIFYLFLSMDPIRYRLFLWIGVFDLGLAMIITIIHMSLKTITWVQGFVGVIINPIFIVILLYSLAKETEGRVVLVSGEKSKASPEQKLPPHIAGKHPLHRK